MVITDHKGPADPARSYCFSCGMLRPKEGEETMGWGEGCCWMRDDDDGCWVELG